MQMDQVGHHGVDVGQGGEAEDEALGRLLGAGFGTRSALSAN